MTALDASSAAEEATAQQTHLEARASSAPAAASAQLREVLLEQGAALRRMASAWTRSSSERDDLVQDIALSLLVALPTFRHECPRSAFVWRVAHHRCLLAAHRRRQPAGKPHDELGDEHASDAPSPHARLEHAQRRQALQVALRTLSEDHRAVLVLSFEGLSHEQIGDVLGASANAVGVRLHRARAALTTAMQAPTTPTRRSP
jgi:RNA polymerase sigma-70 factor (ECF subfamily)